MPFMHPFTPWIGVALYIGFVMKMQNLNRERKGPWVGEWINWFALIHNVFLVILSLVMCVGIIAASFERAASRGWFSIICGDVSGRELLRGKLGFWIYVYYVSKYYELIDTLILLFESQTSDSTSYLSS